MTEFASQISKNMIDMLLNVHALTNMHRSSDNDEYRRSAAGWISTLEDQMAMLKRELTKERRRD